MKKTRVLFLCTHNAVRSQMAEAFLREFGAERFEAYSAGLRPTEIHPYTIEVMDEVGIDVRDQYPKGLKPYMGRVHFGYLVYVCDRAEEGCPTAFPGMGHRLDWPFEDPLAYRGRKKDRLEKFREVRDLIGARIQRWLGIQS